MPTFPLPAIPKVTLTSVIDVLAVAVLIYNFFLMVRGRRAAHVLSGIWVLLLAYAIAVWTHLDLLRDVLATMAPYTAIALIVMFQAEIRRMLARIGRVRWLGLGGQLEQREVVDDILLAVRQMAEH
jgi:diadenylate cyclase